MPIITKTTYTCPICGQPYDNMKEAQACLDQGIIGGRDDLSVGDIVTYGAGFGWFNGDVAWVVNPDAKRGPRYPQEGDKHGPVEFGSRKELIAKNCFDWCCTMGFYYVIVVKDHVGHKECIEMRTAAMSGDKSPRAKEAMAPYLEYIKKVENPPPEILERAAELVKEFGEPGEVK